MDRRLTVVFFRGMDYRIRKITIPASVFSCICAVLAICLFFSILAGVDYCRLKKNARNTRELKNRLAGQHSVIHRQTHQLQQFSAELDQVKSTLTTLSKFEEKLRIIADINVPDLSNGILGVGGSDPGNSDFQWDRIADHQALMKNVQNRLQSVQKDAEHQTLRLKSLYTALDHKLTILSCTPSIRPTRGWISSRFGYRESPFTGEREFHRGLDIATHTGTPVVAPADGVVAYAGPKGLLGRVVVVNHGHGMITRYGHLHKILCQRGDPVKRGDKIGRVGSTGRSTGPHLHYEVLHQGIPANPIRYILN